MLQVNDAPALKVADVGIAVAGSTDAARAAADIILTEEGLSTIIHGIVIAREIFSRISNFVTYRVRMFIIWLLPHFALMHTYSSNNHMSKSIPIDLSNTPTAAILLHCTIRIPSI